MRTLFLTSSGLNEKTMVLFWKCIGKEPINTKAILVPSAAVGNDGAREGIIVCMERLMNMGIPMNNILIYNWNGECVCRLFFDKKLFNICITDNNKELIAIEWEKDFCLYSFDLSKVL